MGLRDAVFCAPMNWISVKDRLPDLHRFVSGHGWGAKTYVLGVDGKGRMGVGFYTDSGRWTCARAMGDPTHWQSLPDAPAAALSSP